MKKLKTALCLVFCFMIAGIFCACGQEVQLSISQTNITILKGETFDLKELIDVENAELENVKIKSFNNQICYITPDYLVGGVSVGRTQVEISLNDKNVYVTVSVISSSMTLDTPVGLRYDSSINAVVWNEVYGNAGSEIFACNSYTVWVKKNNETPVEHIVLNPKYEITEEGTYEIKVKTNSRNANIIGSDYGETISVEKLGLPTSLQFNASNSVLSWNGTSTQFEVSVNGVRRKTNQKSMTLDLTQPGQYDICVYSVSDIAGTEEAKSENITLTRLAKPEISVSNGRITWRTQTGVDNYKITIVDNNENELYKQVDATQSSYSLPNMGSGNYKVSVQALAINNYLTSAVSNTVNVIKLNKPVIAFEQDTKKVSALGVTSGQVIDLSIEGYNPVRLNSSNNFTYNFNYTNPAQYVLSAINLAQNANEINSDSSNVIKITQLASPQNLAHNLASNGDSIVTFSNVDGADHYEISRHFENVELGRTTGIYKEDGYNLGNNLTVFNPENADGGIFTLEVLATHTGGLEEGEYVLPNRQSINIERLKDVDIEINNDVISWELISNRTQYDYILIKDGEVHTSDHIQNLTNFAVSSYDYGVYEFKIIARGNGSNVLDSINYTSVNFERVVTLQTPNITFDKTTGKLKITEVANATEYKLKLNNVAFDTILTFEDEKEIDISAQILNAGTYTFSVQATCVQNRLINDSSEKSLTIERLSKPASISVNKDEVTVADYADQTKLATNKYLLKVNDVETKYLNNVENFEIKVKYNAKTAVTNNVYYLDSDISVFNISRLTKPTAPIFDNGTIRWEVCDNGEVINNCILVITQNGYSFSINMADRTSISATDSVITSSINLANPYKVQLYYEVGEITVPDDVYISSLISNELEIQKLAKSSINKVAEEVVYNSGNGTNEKVIAIEWNEITGATNYELIITDISGIDNSFTVNENKYTAYDFNRTGIYKVKVRGLNPDKITSDYSNEVSVERLFAPSMINVSANETLNILNKPASNKLNKTLVQIQVEGQNKNEVTGEINFSEINANFSVFVQYIAVVNNNSNQYYLNSIEKQYNFERISQMSQVSIESGLINWIGLEEADGYELKFSKAGKENKYYKVNDNETVSLSLTNTTLRQYFDYFGTGDVNVSIRALKSPIVNLSNAEIGYLSSLNWSNTSNISILTEPTNVALVATNEEQDSVVISWEHNTTGIVTRYEIYVNDVFMQNVVSGTSAVINDAFLTPNTYTIKVLAVGEGANVTSLMSQGFTFRRLSTLTTSQIFANKQAVLSWQNITNAIGYDLYYALPGESVVKINNVSNPYNFMEKLGTPRLDGVVDIQIRAKGNGTTSLSSSISPAYNFNVLEAPQISVDAGKIITTGTYPNTSNYSIYLTVYKIDGADETIVLNNHSMLTGDEYAIPLSWGEGEYKAVAFSSSSNANGFVNSEITEKTFIKLNAPTNISLTADVTDETQSRVTISFDHTPLTTTNSYEIYSNGTLVTTLVGEKTTTLEDAFLSSGKYNLTVRAIGTGEVISSSPSDAYSFVRIAPIDVNQISVNREGQLNFNTSVTNVIMYYTLPLAEEVKINNIASPMEFYSYLQNEDDELIVGSTQIKLRLVGNGTTTLSSIKSQAYVVEVLSKPTITLEPNSFTVCNGIENITSQKVIVNITRENGDNDVEILKNYEMSIGEKYEYPINWETGTYTISAYKISTNLKGFVSSDIITENVIKIDSPTDLHFTRTTDIDNDSIMNFRAKTVENNSGYYMVIGNNVYSTITFETIDTESGTYLDYKLSGILDGTVPEGDIIIYLMARGGRIGDNYYINSTPVYIEAFKLPKINNLVTNEGKLTWNKNLISNGYRLKINGTFKDINDANIDNEMLEGYQGNLNINIKALGNITTGKNYENVVLDSTYMGTVNEGTLTLTNYDCYKIPTVTDFAVNQGYLFTSSEFTDASFEFYNNDEVYDEITIAGTQLIGERTVYFMLSNKMYTDFIPSQSYTLTVREKNEQENIIYSDISSPINVLIPNVVIDPVWTLKEKITEDAQTYYDYSETYISWDTPHTGNGYLVLINGELYMTNERVFVPPTTLGSEWEFSLAIRGGSAIDTETNAYILNSAFVSGVKTFYTLGDTSISVNNGVLNWRAVPDATGYYVYLNGNVLNNQPVNVTSLNIPTYGVYSVAVQAISTTQDYFAGNKCYYATDVYDETTTIDVTKLNIPSTMEISEGALKFTQTMTWLDDFDVLTAIANMPEDEDEQIAYFEELTYTEIPFTYNIFNILEQNLVLNFRYNNANYSLTIPAMQFLSPTTAQLEKLESIATLLGQVELYEEFVEAIKNPVGWPTILTWFELYGNAIAPGEYMLSYYQLGNSENWLTSNSTTPQNVYVPQMLEIEVDYRDNQYYLNWQSVAIPTKFKSNETTYSFVQQKYDGTIFTKQEVTRTTSTEINLSYYIDAGIVDTTTQLIYVVVLGDNNDVLTSKLSNEINIEVLHPVSVRAVNGELEWDAQSGATGYEITYTGGLLNETHSIILTDNHWDCAELEEGYTYNDVIIKALGSQTVQNDKLIVGGAETNIGTLTKLAKPNYYIEDGIIKWSTIENATSYIYGYLNELSEVNELFEYSPLDNDGSMIEFEPANIDFGTYLFRTVGTETLTLDDTTTTYVNSNFSDVIYTYKQPEITGYETVDGILTWEALEKFANENIKNYRLEFGLGEGNAPIVITINNTNSTTYNGYGFPYIYDNIEYINLLPGTYDVYIQGFCKGNSNNLTGNDINFSTLVDDKVVYLLQSMKQVQGVQITKYDNPKLIQVANGQVTFYDPQKDADALFELEFIGIEGNSNVIITNETNPEAFTYDGNGNWTFEGIVNTNMDKNNISKYNLRIRQLATDNAHMNSNYKGYRTSTEDYDELILGQILGEYLPITQINPITYTEITTKELNDEEEYVISWETYTPANIANSVVSYVFEYYTCNSNDTITNPNWRALTDCFDNGEKYVIYDDLVQDSNTDTLVYRIQVLIANQDNYMHSRWTQNFVIEKPASVAEIIFNTVTQNYEWSYANSDQNNNLNFVVTDFYISDNAEITDIEQLETYEKQTYTIPILRGENNYTFSPMQIGSHVISVEVMVANALGGDNTAFKSGTIYYVDAFGTYNCNYNLFNSGEGTEANPYIISTSAQFDNMRYRLTTPSYLAETICFKQSAHLTINGDIVVDEENTTYVGFIKDEFNVKYDGDRYKLTLSASLSNLNNIGGLFERIGTNGEIKNVNYLVNISGINNINISINAGLLVKYNNGIISNCKLGSSSGVLTLGNISKEFNFGALVYENNGTIKRTANYYNFTFVHSGSTGNSAYINFGGLTYKNKGIINESGNYGNINLTAYEGAYIGGLVSINDTNGYIQESFNKGNITVSYSSYQNHYYFVGGLVGNLAAGSVWNSYNVSTITINHNNTDPVAYFGGLAGYCKMSSLLNNCYSTITFIVAEIGGNTTLRIKQYPLAGFVESRKVNTNCYVTTGETVMAGGAGLNAENISNYETLQSLLNANDGKTDNMFVGAGTTIRPKLYWESDYTAIAWKA